MAGNRRIDRILDPSYLEGLQERELTDIRAMRAEVEEEESLLSYERRMLHGRMDILRAERERRETGGDANTLIQRLPEILADEPLPSRGAIPRNDPPAVEHPRRRVERLVSDDALARMMDLSEDELTSILTTLEQAEQETSDQRRAVLDVLDRLTAEVGRRYRSGEANPEDVLAGGR